MAPAALLGYVAFFAVRYFFLERKDAWERNSVSERRGINAACGVAGAAYVLAGIAKLRTAGFGWLDGRNLALLIAERSYDSNHWLAALRRLVSLHPHFCTALACASLAMELSGWLFIFKRFRLKYAAASIFFHFGIGALMGYFLPDWPLTLVALALAPA